MQYTHWVKTPSEILQEAEAEIQYQADRFGGGDVDKLLENDRRSNTENDFVAYITHYATRWFPGGFRPHTDDTLREFRASMIKVMALAVSAVRWVDSKLALRAEMFPATPEETPVDQS